MNAFQEAGVELNCAILGYRTPSGKPDLQRLKALGGGQNIRFLQGNSGKDCNENDADSPCMIEVPGYGHTVGGTLAEAKAAMLKKIEGATQTVDAAKGKKS